MTNTNVYNNPGAGLLEQTIAASGEMQLTGTDRELIKKRVGDIDTTKSFTEVVGQLLNKTSNIAKTEPKSDKKFDLVNIKHKANHSHIVMPTEEKTSQDGSLAQEGYAVEPPLPIEPQDNFSNSQDLLLTLVKEYGFAYGKTLLGLEADDLSAHRDTIKAAKFGDKILENLHNEVSRMIQRILSDTIHNTLLERLNDPRALTSIILKSKKAHLMLGYFFSKNVLINLADLAVILKELKLDPTLILKDWNLDSLTLSQEGKLILENSEAAINEKEILIKGLRLLSIKTIFTMDPAKKKELKEKIKKINVELIHMGVTVPEIYAVFEEAKKIAWLKSIVVLKKLHFKRLLSTTQEEFKRYSRLIEVYTVSVRDLGLKITHEGTRLVEMSLDVTSYNAAKYKLELLQSMQDLNYDAERAKNIEWLSALAADLGKKVPQKS